jgi:hypothetical protein
MARNPLSIINFKGLLSDLPEWRKCAWILFVSLVVPAFLVFLLAEWISWQAGDWLSMPQAAALQTAHPNMLWYKYRTAKFARFKLARVAIDRPDVLIFGQSRCQYFRAAMFHPYTAYNLSSTCYLMSAFTDLLRHLPAGYNPKVIIMTCDFWMFSPVYSATQVKARALQNFSPSWMDKVDDLHDILVQLPVNPSLLLIGLYQPHPYPTLGLGAYLGNGGFRKDGSIQFDDSNNGDLAVMQNPLGSNIDCGDHMGTAEMKDFEEFVTEAHARGIAVVGVQMPFYSGEKLATEYENKPGFGELRDFDEHVKDGYFNNLHVLFFNFMNLPGYSGKPEYFQDEVHPKEGATLAVLSKMASDPSFLSLLPNLDIASIKEKLAQDRQSKTHSDLYPTKIN